MFITPYFGGCKYTNNFLFINKNIEIQHLDLLITFSRPRSPQQARRQSLNDARFPGEDGGILHKFLYIWELGQEDAFRVEPDRRLDYGY